MIKDKVANARGFIFDMCKVGDSCVSVVCNMLQSGFLTRKQMDKLLLKLLSENKLEFLVSYNSLQEPIIDYWNIKRIK